MNNSYRLPLLPSARLPSIRFMAMETAAPFVVSQHQILHASKFATTFPMYRSLSEKDLAQCDVLEYIVDARNEVVEPFPSPRWYDGVDGQKVSDPLPHLRWGALGNLLVAVLSTLKDNPDTVSLPQIAGVLFEGEEDQPMVFLRNTSLLPEEKAIARTAKVRLAALRKFLATCEEEKGWCALL